MRPTVIALADADAGAWRDLAGRAVEPNPFFEPEFVLPAVRGLRATGVALLVVRDGSTWHAAVPVKRAPAWRKVPVPALVSWRHDYCFLGTPLATDAGRDALARGPWHGRPALLLDWVSDGFLDGTVLKRWKRAAFAPGDEIAIRGVHRKELRRLRRRMGGEVSFTSATVDEFLAVEAAGWKGRGGTALGADPGRRAFFEEMCAGFGDRAELRALRVGDRPAAVSCMLRTRGTAYQFKIGYDEAFAPFSPGIQLELDVAETANSPIDSCADPGNEMIERLWSRRRAIATIALGPRPLTGVMARMARHR